MQIQANGKRNITLDFDAPKKFKLLQNGVEIPYLRTGKNSIRLSKDVNGLLDLEEIPEAPKAIVKPMQLQPQQMALVNPADVISINQAAQQLEIEQNILNENQKRFENTQEFLNIQQQRINETVNAVQELETNNADRITVTEQSIFNLAGKMAKIEEDSINSDIAVASDLEAHKKANNPHNITKETIGLNKVDNTADMDKPVSNAVKMALEEKADKDDIEQIREEIAEYQDKNEKINNALANYTGGIGGNELPIGGLTGQVLAKKSDENGDYEWISSSATANDGQLDIRVNGTSIATFTANQVTNTTANIVVPDSATWGNVTGDIADQTDLQDALDDKQDKLTAGTDLEIVQGSILPNSYTQLTSITSTGTQWINSGIKLTNSFKSIIVGRLSGTPANNFRTILGANDNSLSQGKQNVLLGWGNSSNGFYAEPCLFPSYTYSSYPWDTNTHTFTTNITPTITTLDVDGVVDTINSAPSITGVNLAIFARLAQDGTVGSQVNFELNSIELYQSGSLVFKGVPAKRNSDDEVGLYDTVSGSFFSNSGTGDFISGSEVPASTVINFTNDSGYITGINSTDVTTALGYTPVNPSSLATVAISGDYDDLTNKPTIPTVGDGTITITQGGVTKGTFTTNQSGNASIDLDAGGGLPDQTGNAGKFLNTDGTDASWQYSIRYIGNYNSSTQYYPGDIVQYYYDNTYRYYLCIQPALGKTPYNETSSYWKPFDAPSIIRINNVSGDYPILPFNMNGSSGSTITGVVLRPGTTSTITNFPTINTSTGLLKAPNGIDGYYTSAQVDALIPTVNNSTITFTQGGVNKGSFTLNQSTGATIALDAGGGGGSITYTAATETLTWS